MFFKNVTVVRRKANKQTDATKMPQPVQVLAAKPDNVSSIPETRIVED